MEGTVLGSYRLVQRIGEGGMGVVYLAEHNTIGRKAAVKLLLPEFSREPEIVGRFFNEARATSMIDHPGLVTIFDFGHHEDGLAFIVMEFLHGEPLTKRIRAQKLQPMAAVAIGRQVCSALAAAHARGIVHRDLKPDNIFLVPDREVNIGVRAKVLDFGIAKLMGDEGVAGAARTRTGVIMGTPLYMSPEQCRGAGEVDARSDVYSMGCILYEMVAGRPPFEGAGAGEIIGAHMHVAPLPLRKAAPGTPKELEAVVMRALEKPVERRQQSMAELEGELEGLSRTLRSKSGTGPVALTDPTVVAPGLPGPGSVPRLPSAAGHKASTTLGSSMGQSVPSHDSASWAGHADTMPPPSRRGRTIALVAAGVVLVAGAALGARALLGGKQSAGSASASASPSVSASVAPSVSASPTVEPSPSPSPTVVASPSPSAEPSPTASASASATPSPSPTTSQTSKVDLVITSEPSGAAVLIDGKRVGKTPYRVAVAPDAAARSFTLRCGGYEDARGSISPAAPKKRIKLTRQPGTPFGLDCD